MSSKFHRPRPTRALLLLLFPTSLACTEEVGSCDDPRVGKDTVVAGGFVQYGGQAIMNQACATGCHASTASGSARNGAPVGLDFDLRPISEDEVEGTSANGNGDTVLMLTAEQVAGLRGRQRNVFENRNLIWQQVKDELMPPGGMFETFKSLVGIANSPEDTPCAAQRPYAPITEKRSMDVLRNWLACGAPIVETNGTAIEKSAVAGRAGFQYPSCGETGGDGGAGDVITLERVQTEIFERTACAACHPAFNSGFKLDLTSVAKSYETLVLDTAVQCEGKPYVTPGDPDKSFLLDIVAEEEPACSQRMPQGGQLTSAQIALIRGWIEGGALRESDLTQRTSAGDAGIDAGR